jgi:hypothetical protein
VAWRDEKCIQILAGKPEVNRLLGWLGMHGMIMLKWVRKKSSVKLTGFNWLRMESNGRLL